MSITRSIHESYWILKLECAHNTIKELRSPINKRKSAIKTQQLTTTTSDQKNITTTTTIMGETTVHRKYFPKTTLGTALLCIINIFIPPLAVFLDVGLNVHFWLNLLLFFFTVWIGALIHGFYVIFRGHQQMVHNKATTTTTSSVATYA
jgi:uncharacterized membrane protein YqaE (UPF0057 family)